MTIEFSHPLSSSEGVLHQPLPLHRVLEGPMITLRESNASVEVTPGGLSTAVQVTFRGGGRPLVWGFTRAEAVQLASALVECAEAEVAS